MTPRALCAPLLAKSSAHVVWPLLECDFISWIVCGFLPCLMSALFTLEKRADRQLDLGPTAIKMWGQRVRNQHQHQRVSLKLRKPTYFSGNDGWEKRSLIYFASCVIGASICRISISFALELKRLMTSKKPEFDESASITNTQNS